MKPLVVSYADARGGAARAAYRLHRSLIDSGVESRMLVRRKFTDDDTVEGPAPSLELVTRARSRLGSYFQRLQQSSDPGPHSSNPFPTRWSTTIRRQKADVVNLHWLGASTMSIEDIGRIEAPVVFTLHDMWAFCGSEHYTNDLGDARWKSGYTRANRSETDLGLDLDRWTWNRKRRHWEGMTVIAPSRWLATCAAESALMSRWPIHVIPNPLDTSVFRPRARAEARKTLGLPQSKTILLSGAVGLHNDPRKGLDLLEEALLRLRAHGLEYHGISFSSDSPEDQSRPTNLLHQVGPVKSDETLALLYSAADVMVVPSRVENLPQTATEAQACGTPVVAFDTGGLPDAVVHNKTGYLASPFDVEDLARGISWALENAERTKALGRAAQDRAERLWSPSTVAARYLDVYGSVVRTASEA